MDQSPSSEANSSSASQKFLAFFGKRKFIFASTGVHHISISWATWFPCKTPSYFLKTHFNIILSSTPTSFKLALSPAFCMQNLKAPHLSPKWVTLICDTIPKTVWRGWGETHEEYHSRQSVYRARSEPVTSEIKFRRFTATPCLLGLHMPKFILINYYNLWLHEAQIKRKSNSKCITTVISLRCLYGMVFGAPRRNQIVSGYNTGTAHQDPVRLSDTSLPASIRDKDSAYGDKSVRWLHRKKNDHTTLRVYWCSVRLRDFIIFWLN